MRLYAACIALFLFSSLADANDDEHTRATLRGLNGVRVIVEDLPPEAEQNGLRVSDIRTDVELKLRLAGIRVVDDKEFPSSSGAVLEIDVNLNTPSDSVWTYSLTVELVQPVVLKRDPSIMDFADTWRVGEFGRRDKSRIGTLRFTVKDEVDKFINAYLAMNPKK